MFSHLKDSRAIALLLAATLTILSNTLISPALPGIQAHFAGQPYAELLTRMLVTAPALLVAIFAPFAGVLADRFGRRPQLLAGVILFAIAGSAGMWLPSLPLILASRLVLGLAVALIMTAQTALIGDYFSGADLTRFMGLQQAATNFGGLLFLLMSGWLAGWSPFAPFVLYAIALLYLPLFWVALPEPVHVHVQYHPNSQVQPTDDSGEPGWLMTFATIVVLAVVSMACFYILPTQAPYFLAYIGFPEPSTTAFFLGAVTLAGGVASLTFGHVHERLGSAKTSAMGFGFFAAGFVLFAIADDLPMVFAGALGSGTAIGLTMPIFMSIALDVAPARRRGIAAGVVTTSIYLGQFLSPLISQPLIDTVGFSRLFSMSAIALALLGVLSLISFRGQSATGCLDHSPGTH